MLQLTINLLPVNHEPFFLLSYYIVRDFSEASGVGSRVIEGTCMLLFSCIWLCIIVLINVVNYCDVLVKEEYHSYF